MRPRRVRFAALVIASCLTVACSSSAPEVTAPGSPDSGGSTQPPADNPPPRPPQPPVPPAPAPPEHTERCDDRKAQWAIGEIGTQDLLERARVTAGAEFARFLRLDQPVTQEYRIGRLNLVIDGQDIVRKVQCW